MRIIIILLLTIGLVAPCSSQSKQDYIWHFGSDQIESEEGVQASQINFNDTIITPRLREGGLEFDRNNASISDRDGNLLIYTNGCAVANRLGQIMPNGDSINAGEIFDLQWNGDCTRGYTGRQDIMILPDPGDSNQFYIFHKPREYQLRGFYTYKIILSNYKA